MVSDRKRPAAGLASSDAAAGLPAASEPTALLSGVAPVAGTGCQPRFDSNTCGNPNFSGFVVRRHRVVLQRLGLPVPTAAGLPKVGAGAVPPAATAAAKVVESSGVDLDVVLTPVTAEVQAWAEEQIRKRARANPTSLPGSAPILGAVAVVPVVAQCNQSHVAETLQSLPLWTAPITPSTVSGINHHYQQQQQQVLLQQHHEAVQRRWLQEGAPMQQQGRPQLQQLMQGQVQQQTQGMWRPQHEVTQPQEPQPMQRWAQQQIQLQMEQIQEHQMQQQMPQPLQQPQQQQVQQQQQWEKQAFLLLQQHAQGPMAPQVRQVVQQRLVQQQAPPQEQQQQTCWAAAAEPQGTVYTWAWGPPAYTGCCTPAEAVSTQFPTYGSKRGAAPPTPMHPAPNDQQQLSRTCSQPSDTFSTSVGAAFDCVPTGDRTTYDSALLDPLLPSLLQPQCSGTTFGAPPGLDVAASTPLGDADTNATLLPATPMSCNAPDIRIPQEVPHIQLEKLYTAALLSAYPPSTLADKTGTAAGAIAPLFQCMPSWAPMYSL